MSTPTIRFVIKRQASPQSAPYWEEFNLKIQKGLVLSLVIEHGEQGLASEWLADFLDAHEELLRPYLGAYVR